MRKALLGVLGIVCVASMASACSSSSGGGGSDGSGWENDPSGETEPEPDIMRRDDICLEDSCQSCETACSECMSVCYQAMIGSSEFIDCSSACSYSCSGDCSSACSDPICVESKPGFALPQQADPAVEAACQRAVARDQSCGETTVLADCAHYARVERPEVVTNYDCIVQTPCGESTEACSVTPTTLGDELCSRVLDACDGSCVAETISQLNYYSGWLRDDVRDALRTCWSSSCDALLECADAWLNTVYPS